DFACGRKEVALLICSHALHVGHDPNAAITIQDACIAANRTHAPVEGLWPRAVRSTHGNLVGSVIQAIGALVRHTGSYGIDHRLRGKVLCDLANLAGIQTINGWLDDGHVAFLNK